jgi:hypothetical protein
MAVRGLPPNSFGGLLPEFLGYYGFPTTGFGYGAYGPAFAAAITRLCAKRRARRCGVSADQNANPQQELRKSRSLRSRIEPWPSFVLAGDYAAADAEIKKALAIRHELRRVPFRRSAMQMSS